MGALPIIRFFRLSQDGVSCGADGVFVGPTALLSRAAGGGWAARPREALEGELSGLYGLPIDLSAKQAGLTTVARALDRGDAPLAAIAAVLLGFPDPPSLAKDAPARGSADLAAQLLASGLIKDWDSLLHPRADCAPNPGWFAPKPADAAQASSLDAPSGRSWMRESYRLGLRMARQLLKGAAKEGLSLGWGAIWLGSKVSGPIEAAVEILDSTELNRGEQQAIDQLRSSLDPPKPFDQLQQPPTQNALGYEVHHIVEQNPANVAKAPVVEAVEKFGRPAIDDPSNLVWTPRLLHELITGYYNSKDGGDPTRLHRQVVNELDFLDQRAEGLAVLCKYGVLQ